MYRSAVRSTPRALSAARQSAIRAAPRRFASTAPADKPRTWKSSALRWGAAFGALYWYNTSPVFAEEPVARTIPAPSQFSDADLTTVDAIVEEKRKRTIVKAEQAKPAPAAPAQPTANAQAIQTEGEPAPGSPEALEAEADQQGAFNPETGEINWDCPCLGGMADGPCGEEFKAAFSCFVYSKEEPKGMDCIEKFQGMQTCFRKYPDVYGAELADDEEGPAPDDAQPILDANADASIPPAAEVKKEAPKEAPKETKQEPKETKTETPKAEVTSDSEIKKVEIKAEPEKKETEKKTKPKKAAKVESVDLTKSNTAATDATAANDT